jgi:hypothetical protein
MKERKRNFKKKERKKGKGILKRNSKKKGRKKVDTCYPSTKATIRYFAYHGGIKEKKIFFIIKKN